MGRIDLSYEIDEGQNDPKLNAHAYTSESTMATSDQDVTVTSSTVNMGSPGKSRSDRNLFRCLIVMILPKDEYNSSPSSCDADVQCLRHLTAPDNELLSLISSADALQSKEFLAALMVTCIHDLITIIRLHVWFATISCAYSMTYGDRP